MVRPWRRWQSGPVTTIKINAITVPAGSGDELAHRFAARAGAVDGAEGFEGFELLQPTDDRTTWLVVTRWRDEDAFNAWVSSPAFGAGHQSEAKPKDDGGEAPKPVGVSSELWSYTVAGGSTVTTSSAVIASSGSGSVSGSPVTGTAEVVAGVTGAAAGAAGFGGAGGT